MLCGPANYHHPQDQLMRMPDAGHNASAEPGVSVWQEHAEGEQNEEEEEADGEVELPSDYSADGVLTATLQTFADLRIISEPHAPAAARADGGGALMWLLVWRACMSWRMRRCPHSECHDGRRTAASFMLVTCAVWLRCVRPCRSRLL